MAILCRKILLGTCALHDDFYECQNLTEEQLENSTSSNMIVAISELGIFS